MPRWIRTYHTSSSCPHNPYIGTLTNKDVSALRRAYRPEWPNRLPFPIPLLDPKPRDGLPCMIRITIGTLPRLLDHGGALCLVSCGVLCGTTPCNCDRFLQRAGLTCILQNVQAKLYQERDSAGPAAAIVPQPRRPCQRGGGARRHLHPRLSSATLSVADLWRPLRGHGFFMSWPLMYAPP